MTVDTDILEDIQSELDAVTASDFLDAAEVSKEEEDIGLFY